MWFHRVVGACDLSGFLSPVKALLRRSAPGLAQCGAHVGRKENCEDNWKNFVMAISADVSTPIDDKHGGEFSWGRFQQNKAKLVYVYINVPEGTRGRQVQVCVCLSVCV